MVSTQLAKERGVRLPAFAMFIRLFRVLRQAVLLWFYLHMNFIAWIIIRESSSSELAQQQPHVWSKWSNPRGARTKALATCGLHLAVSLVCTDCGEVRLLNALDFPLGSFFFDASCEGIRSSRFCRVTFEQGHPNPQIGDIGSHGTRGFYSSFEERCSKQEETVLLKTFAKRRDQKAPFRNERRDKTELGTKRQDQRHGLRKHMEEQVAKCEATAGSLSSCSTRPLIFAMRWDNGKKLVYCLNKLMTVCGSKKQCPNKKLWSF